MAFLVVLVLSLAAYNNVTNLRRLPEAAYVPANLTLAAVLLWAARQQGLSWAALGLDPARLGAGLRLGLLVTSVVALAVFIAPLVPAARPLLGDRRFAGLSPTALAWQVLVRIPLGTVVLEEVAFRGVLLATWEREASITGAVLGSSVVFGLWHIGPSVVTMRKNGVTGGRAGVGVAGAVVVTTIAGILFAALREASGSLVAPMLVHTATNSLGGLAAWISQRRAARVPRR